MMGNATETLTHVLLWCDTNVSEDVNIIRVPALTMTAPLHRPLHWVSFATKVDTTQDLANRGLLYSVSACKHSSSELYCTNGWTGLQAAMGKEEKQKKHSSKEDQICQPLYSSFYWSCPVYFQNPKTAVNMTVGVRWTLCKYTEDCLNTELVNHTAVHSEHRRVQTARVSRPTLQQSNLTQASNQQCLFANNQQV